jgi:hypothetical protein
MAMKVKILGMGMGLTAAHKQGKDANKFCDGKDRNAHNKYFAGKNKT